MLDEKMKRPEIGDIRIVRRRRVDVGRDIGIYTTDTWQQYKRVDSEEGISYRDQWVDVPIVYVELGDDEPD
jgi:hypothetical protein